jgi:hypothetical protein
MNHLLHARKWASFAYGLLYTRVNELFKSGNWRYIKIVILLFR